MNRIRSIVLVLALSLFGPTALAQHEEKPVLMHDASFHVPIFSNDYVTMLRINIPPGRDSGYHTHYADSVSVNLSPAIRTDQRFGESKVSAPAVGEPNPGRVSFNTAGTTGEYTHKATNVGPTPFHNVSFILKDRPAGNGAGDRSGVEGYTQVLDNARIRAWRTILEPGESTGQITQRGPGLRVYVRGGVLDEIVPGAADRGMAPYTGDFIWQDAGKTRAVKNTGSTVIEFVEFELK